MATMAENRNAMSNKRDERLRKAAAEKQTRHKNRMKPKGKSKYAKKHPTAGGM